MKVRILQLFLLLPFFFQAHAQTGSCPGQKKIRVILKPDNKPAETSWDLVAANGDTLKKGLANSDSICVPDSLCVRFTIHDKGNNGLCCTNGQGAYSVYYGDFLVRRAYKFKSQEVVNMGCKSCVPNANQRKIKVYINPDRFPAESSWNLLNANGDTLAKGKDQSDTLCIPKAGCLRFNMLDTYGDGICCNNGIGDYRVFSDDSLLFSGGAFTFKANHIENCPSGFDCSSAVTASLDTFTTYYDDTWYKFRPDTSGKFLISTCNLGNNCNTKIWVYDYCTGLNPSEGNAGTLAYSFSGCGLQASLSVILNKNQTYYIRIGDDFNTCNPDSVHWALSYLGPVRGCTDPASCTYNPLATVSDPTMCLYNPDTSCPDQPDLVVNSDLLRTTFKFDSLTNNDACYIQEGCLKGYGMRYIARFSTRIENIGEADYYIGKPPANQSVPSTQWIWDPCHGHWHYKGYAEYILYDRNSNPIPAGFKAGFCVMDLNCSVGGGTPKYNCANQGITAGCGDIYNSSLKCQWVDITDVDTGRYTLVARVNWDNSPDLLGRIESNLNNNWGQVCFQISKNSAGRRFVNVLPNCNPYVDCDGQVFGSAVRDCNGNCHGTSVHGNINSDTVRNEEDLTQYIGGILSGNLSSTTCSDLNGDNHLDITDVQMLAKCLDESAASPSVPASCTFHPLISNTTNVVKLSIDTVNLAEGFADIAILNPNEEVGAFQFSMSGLSVDSVRFLNLPDSGKVNLYFNSSGKIMGSLVRNRIARHSQSDVFLRVYFDTTTATQVCIQEITAVLSPALQLLGKSTGPCKNTGTVTYLEQRSGKQGLRLVPNPFSGKTRLYFSNPGNVEHSLVLYDVHGKQIRRETGIRGTEHSISAEGLHPGIYFFRLNGKESRTGKLWVE